MFQKLFAHPVIRFLFVGGLTYIVDIGILIGLHYGLHIQRAIATSASFWVGLLFSFGLQKLVAFQDYQKEIKAISKQAIWYGVLIAINYFFTIFIVSFFPDKDLILSRTVAVIITACWNYFFYKHIIFRSNGKTAQTNT
jgi:putative flippase GtrA